MKMKCKSFFMFCLKNIVLVFLFINYSECSFPSISFVELVEEWGCIDSEFRLTCNSLDSKLAILEASFAPHCEKPNCAFYDEDSVTKIITNNLYRKENEEEIAATHLLEILRRNHKKDEDEETEEARTSEYKSEMLNTTDINETSPTTTDDSEIDSILFNDDPKLKKKTLRNSLEKLITLYLNKIHDSSNEDYGDSDNHIRYERDLRFEEHISDQVKYNIQKRKKKTSKTVCRDSKRAIRTLDRFEIEQSVENRTSKEFNIRKLLNYRCSGKNHCSFIFEKDHPFSIFWDAGIVHIKYICMDEFRINRYCGEHLQIGSEITTSDETSADDKLDEEWGVEEPRAEARLSHMENYHQFTNLKIIKAAPKEENRTVSSSKAPVTEMKFAKIMDKPRVFSQDFTRLKILRNDIEGKEDIEKVKKEEYIFKKPTVVVPDSNEIGQFTTVKSLSDLETATEFSEELEFETSFDDNEIDNNEVEEKRTYKSSMASLFTTAPSTTTTTTTTTEATTTTQSTTTTTENVEIIIIEGEEYLTLPNSTDTTVQKPSFRDTIGSNLSDHELVKQVKDLLQKKKTSVYTAVLNGTDVPTTQATIDDLKHNKILDEIRLFDVDGLQPTEDEDEDNEEEIESFDTHYSSKQYTVPRRKLSQGFLLSPGYPKFYIGNTGKEGCKWRITLDEGQKIRLTIFDLAIKYDKFCKDYLEVIDVVNRKRIFRSCSENQKPIVLVSDSNILELNFKTKSKNAYPKRGFLIHYAAASCLLLPIPSHVKLIEKKEHLLKYSCKDSFIFPDTGEKTRTLTCLQREEVWNNSLPNCIEEGERHGKPLHLGKPRRRDEMSKGDSDSIYDVLIPSLLIAGLFVVNAIVFLIIMRYRKNRDQRSLGLNDRELAEL